MDLNYLDLLIVNYNSTDALFQCLDSIFNTNGDIVIKVFVCDNNSHDYVDTILHKFPQIDLVKNRCNNGFAKGVNCLLKKGTAPYVMLLNPDTIVFKGLFEKSLNYMNVNQDAGIMGPKIVNRDGSTQGSARSFPSLHTALFGRSSLFTRLFPNNRFSRANILTLDSNGKTSIEADWVSGACMIVRRKAMKDIGAMDERFFMYWEDADWCKRMWQKGWKVVYNPCASIMHYVGVSSNKSIFRSVFSFHRSTYKFFKKYNKESFFLLHISILCILSLRFCIVVLMHGAKEIKNRILRIGRSKKHETDHFFFKRQK
jgi:GT2 family glycosyltransferase